MKAVPIILVVEDEESLQEIVHDALKEGGFDLTTVSGDSRLLAAAAQSSVARFRELTGAKAVPAVAGKGGY